MMPWILEPFLVGIIIGTHVSRNILMAAENES